MTIRGQAPTESFATSPDDEASRALVYDAPATEVPRYRARASLARSNGDATAIGPLSKVQQTSVSLRLLMRPSPSG